MSRDAHICAIRHGDQCGKLYTALVFEIGLNLMHPSFTLPIYCESAYMLSTES